MNQFVAIALGGSIGALARFWVANGIHGWLGRDFPHGTLFVNVSGSFLMGILTELMLQRFPLSVEYRAAILVGFLGAYTTFSTFAIESLYLIEQGGYWKAAMNVFLSVTLCLTAVWVGLVLGRRWFAGEVYLAAGLGADYGKLAVAGALGLSLGLISEPVFRFLTWPAPWRAAMMIAVLAILTGWIMLTLLPRISVRSAGWEDLFEVVAVSAGGALVSVWLGVFLGKRL